MSTFSEILAKPLPSAQNISILTEGVDCDEGMDTTIPSPMDNATNTGDDLLQNTLGADIPVTDDIVPVEDETPVAMDSLTPDESRRVDDRMNAVATPLLMQSEMTEEEIKEFVESADSDIAVAEGFLTERTIVKFDKNAKKAQLYEVAVAAVAREKKDPLYKKLQTVYKMERILKAKLRVKYNAPAQKKVKEYLARAKKSKSGILARIAEKLTGK